MSFLSATQGMIEFIAETEKVNIMSNFFEFLKVAHPTIRYAHPIPQLSLQSGIVGGSSVVGTTAAGATSSGSMGAALTASMAAHPVGWAIGAGVAVVGLGYVIYRLTVSSRKVSPYSVPQ